MFLSSDRHKAGITLVGPSYSTISCGCSFKLSSGVSKVKRKCASNEKLQVFFTDVNIEPQTFPFLIDKVDSADDEADRKKKKKLKLEGTKFGWVQSRN